MLDMLWRDSGLVSRESGIGIKVTRIPGTPSIDVRAKEILQSKIIDIGGLAVPPLLVKYSMPRGIQSARLGEGWNAS
jgi:hypothetical protein